MQLKVTAGDCKRILFGVCVICPDPSRKIFFVSCELRFESCSGTGCAMGLVIGTRIMDMGDFYLFAPFDNFTGSLVPTVTTSTHTSSCPRVVSSFN
jgi:hypothetical protein